MGKVRKCKAEKKSLGEEEKRRRKGGKDNGVLDLEMKEDEMEARREEREWKRCG